MVQKLRPQAETLYGLPQPLQSGLYPPIIAKRDPTSNDTGYSLGQVWVNKINNTYWVLTSVSGGSANWEDLSNSGTASIATLTGDTGGAISPTAGNINIIGGDTTTVSGSGSTLTISTSTAGYPVTPYVVGSSGEAGYQTIQSALTAAGATGTSQMLYIQPGTYTENLTFPDVNISIWGDRGGNSVIIGQHTPSPSANLELHSLLLQSATNILDSNAAGTSSIEISDTFIIVTDGYVFNLPNWTGELLLDDCGEASTNDGVVNNTAGSPIKFLNTEMGAGFGRTMTLTGNANVRFDTCNVNCPVNIGGSGTLIMQNGCKFADTVTIGGSKAGTIVSTDFLTDANPSLVYNSSGNTYLSGCTINSSSNPAIDGTGVGTLTLGGMNFVDGSNIAGTLTLAWSSTKTGSLTTTGNIDLPTAGNKLSISTGANASVGTSAAMVAGTVTVNTTAVTASSLIFLSVNTPGGTQGTLSAPTASIVAGTSFVINSSSNTDTSTVNWWLIN